MTEGIEKRLGQCEEKLITLEVDMQKLSLKLQHNEETDKRHFEALSTSQIEIKDMLKERAKMEEARAKEAREYRQRREEQEAAEKAAHNAWLRSLVNPQTLVILAAVLASMLGLQAAELGALLPATDDAP